MRDALTSFPLAMVESAGVQRGGLLTLGLSTEVLGQKPLCASIAVLLFHDTR